MTDLVLEWIKENNNPIYNKIAGLIYGCAIADCLGVQVEGRKADEIKERFPTGVTDMPSQDMRGIVHGDWTDDTDQLICLLDTLTETNLNYNMSLFADKIYNWCKHGYPELGDLAGMGLGQLTARVISKDCFKRSPMRAAIEAYKELGHRLAPNGAIMRCGIAAICPQWKSVAIKQCVITHVDCRCIFSSWACVYMCRWLFSDFVPNYYDILSYSDEFIYKKHRKEFDNYARIYKTENLDDMLKLLQLDGEGIGYTLKALGVAFYTLRRIKEQGKSINYKKIILEIINAGGDTDTNAAVAGQVLGSYIGYKALPTDWLYSLKHKQWLDQKIIRLFNVIKEDAS